MLGVCVCWWRRLTPCENAAATHCSSAIHMCGWVVGLEGLCHGLCVVHRPLGVDLDVAFLRVNVRQPARATVQVQGMDLLRMRMCHSQHPAAPAVAGSPTIHARTNVTDPCHNGLGSGCALQSFSSAHPRFCSGLQGGHVSIIVYYRHVPLVMILAPPVVCLRLWGRL